MTNRLGIAGVPLAAAVLMLVAGLAIGLGFTQHELKRVRQLAAERSELQGQMGALWDREREEGEFAQWLGASDLATGLATYRCDDVLNQLGALVTEGGLQGLEVGAQGRIESARLRQTQYFVRAQGSFAQILNLLRRAEQTPPLVAVDALAIAEAGVADLLEVRLNLSVYEPAAGR